MDIVVYSDDRALPSVLQRALGVEYTIRSVLTDQELPSALARGGIAAVVLDLSRVEQGPAFCMWLRAQTDLPTLVIAHPRDVHERVRLLRAGADDVVSWPFEITEAHRAPAREATLVHHSPTRGAPTAWHDQRLITTSTLSDEPHYALTWPAMCASQTASM